MNKTLHHGLGVFEKDDKVFFLYKKPIETNHFIIDSSTDSIAFEKLHDQSYIIDQKGKKQDIQKCSQFKISSFNNQFILTYKLQRPERPRYSPSSLHERSEYKFQSKKQPSLEIATSVDLIKWMAIGKIATVKDTGILIPNFKYQNQYVLYFEESTVKIAFSKNLKKWQVASTQIEPYQSFDNPSILRVENITIVPEGILLIYSERENQLDFSRCWLWAAIFDIENPKNLLWRSRYPIWEFHQDSNEQQVNLVGVTVFKGELISYWENQKEGIFTVNHSSLKKLIETKLNFASLFLNRIRQNPILKPILKHFWETKAVFNAAAFYEAGRVHLIYRAIGDNDVSTLGYATSSDGLNIDSRLNHPIYIPDEDFESAAAKISSHLSPYISGGGGAGGAEDPRITKLEDMLYMTYVAYNGSDPPRVALTSIKLADFLNQKWNWKKPVLISPPGVVDKNACILPEKINNKYVIFHRVYPDILIDFVDDLNFDGQKFIYGQYKIKPRPKFWDSRKVGMGPAPIKTEKGWLAIYQGVGDQDPARYKIGAMLLKSDDPTQVLYRSKEPILVPQEVYENEGTKYGVVYPCGAVTIENQLFVYYGGADMVLCAATCDINTFTSQLTTSGLAKLTPIPIRKTYN